MQSLMSAVASVLFVILYHICLPITELQIRGSTEDNSKIIFLISQRKHML